MGHTMTYSFHDEMFSMLCLFVYFYFLLGGQVVRAEDRLKGMSDELDWGASRIKKKKKKRKKEKKKDRQTDPTTQT